MRSVQRRRIGIIGSGKVASVIGRLLCRAGEEIQFVWGRDFSRAEKAAAFIGGKTKPCTLPELARRVDHLLIAVSDDAVAEVAVALAESGFQRGVALHTSAIHGTEALSALPSPGVSTGSVHPLQAITPSRQGMEAVKGSFFAVSAQGPALQWACRIVDLLQGTILRIPSESRALYHAAAVLAGNSLVALLDAALLMLTECGIESWEGRQALAPLIRNCVEQTLEFGPEAALTGPVSRGDLNTVKKHLQALQSNQKLPASVGRLYNASAHHLLEVAVRKGLDSGAALELGRLLQREEFNVR